jgi:hypothetical protein
MENLDIQKSVSKRGKVLLIVNNYKFSFCDKLLNGESRWRCRIPKCNATIYTIGEDFLISRHNLIHSHEELSKSALQKQFVAVAAKRKASEDIGLQPKRIIHSVLKENESDQLTIDDVKSVKRSIYGERRKKFPKLPKSCLELHCALEDIKEKIITNRKENFLMINDIESNIIIFSCDVNLKHLCRCTRIFMDETFKYCPKYFLQLFTLHGYYNGHYIPLAFCLLKDKLTETYAKCLTILLNKCKEINLKFQPEEIVIDFEKSIHNAVKIVWNEVKIIGCRFHISQAWWRKVQELGLSKDYKERTEVGKWIGYCFGLLFLGKKNYLLFCTISHLINK